MVIDIIAILLMATGAALLMLARNIDAIERAECKAEKARKDLAYWQHRALISEKGWDTANEMLGRYMAGFYGVEVERTERMHAYDADTQIILNS